MRKNFFITLAAIACESYAIRLKAEGLFDSIVNGAGAVAAISGNEDVMNVTNGIGSAATSINDGNYGAGVTGALGSMGGVIPGQAGSVINDLSASTGGVVDGAVSGDYNGLVSNATSGAARVVASGTGNTELANHIDTAG